MSALDFFTGIDAIVCLVAGAIIGWLAWQFLKYGGYGLIVSIVIGMIGGVISGFLIDWLDFMDLGNLLDPIIAGALGAAVLLAIAGAIWPARKDTTSTISGG